MRQFQYDPITADLLPDDDFLDAEHYEGHAPMTSEAAKAAARVMTEDEPVTEEDLPW